MPIRYQPTGTTADMMRLGAKVGQAQGRAKKAQAQAEEANRRGAELRKVRRDQMMRQYDDQMALKAEQRKREMALEAATAREQQSVQLEMMRRETWAMKELETDSKQYDKYQQALTAIHESDQINDQEKEQMELKAELNYLDYNNVYRTDRERAARPRAEDPVQQAIMQMLNPQAQQSQAGAGATVGGAKSLDEATAKQLLMQAGGDKDKARQLATQLGYEL